jgi:hypothetical protein
MRYRLEVIEDEIVVHNVETGLILGTVFPHDVEYVDRPDQTFSACTVLNDAGDELAMISDRTVRNPLGKAPVAVATHERYCGYPGFKAHAAERRRRNRVENRLGTLLADICREVAGGLIEYQTGGFKNWPKDKCAGLIDELYAIWYASCFGSFSDETRLADDPYFCNLTPSGPQLSFLQAARIYGMNELRRRFPDESEEALSEVLCWPLELLRSTLGHSPAAASASGSFAT